jgi:site-specific DNA recombinase
MAPKKRKTEIHPDVIRPAIYLRVSTDEQADSGLGIHAQRTRCVAQCLAKGWPEPREYLDEGISGTIAPGPKRPGLDQLLADVRAGTINAVVVLDLSRLARSVKLVTSMIDELDAADVAFVSCKENFDTSTAMGRAMLGIVAVFGQLERDLTSERTVAALAERGKQHGYKSGRLPFGYRREPGQELIEVDNQAADLVRTVFAARAAGATMRAIAAEMAPVGPGPRGQQWHASTIKTILDNGPYYRGEVDHWPAILEGT